MIQAAETVKIVERPAHDREQHTARPTPSSTPFVWPLEEAGRLAGPFVVEYEAWDDATAAAGQWDPAKAAELANRAASDPSIMVYIGHFNSGAAKIIDPGARTRPIWS